MDFAGSTYKKILNKEGYMKKMALLFTALIITSACGHMRKHHGCGCGKEKACAEGQCDVKKSGCCDSAKPEEAPKK